MAKKNFTDSIRSSFRSAISPSSEPKDEVTNQEPSKEKIEKAEKTEAPIVEATEIKGNVEKIAEVESVISEKKEEKEADSTSAPKEENTAKAPEPVNALEEKTFEDEIEAYNGGFYVIKTSASNKAFAIGLENVENKNLVEPLIVKLIENKDVYYAYMTKDAFGLFKGDWKRKNVQILSLNEGLQIIVNINNILEEERKKESGDNFIKDIDSLGRTRKISTYIQDDLELYCRKRAASCGVYKGQLKFVICNLIIQDKEKHPELM